MNHRNREVDRILGKKTGSNSSNRTQSVRCGDIWWINDMAFNDGSNKKDRPILVVGIDGDKIRYRTCTSQFSIDHGRYLIQDNISAGLDKDTYVDSEVRSIGRGRLHHQMGHLSEYDMDSLFLK